MAGVTHFFEEFQLHSPARDRQGNVHLIYETDNGDKYVFPMSTETFQKFLDLGQDLMGKKVDIATNMEEAVRAGKAAAVPTRPRR